MSQTQRPVKPKLNTMTREISMRTYKHFMWLQKGWGNIYTYELHQPFVLKFHKAHKVGHLWFEFQLLKFGFDIGYRFYSKI